MGMYEKIIMGFALAARDVFKMMLDLETVVISQEPAIIPIRTNDEIVISIGLVGDIWGETYFYFPQETALEIVKMMSGMEVSKVDDFVISALGEISNIISGNAATELSHQKITCEILPPRICFGNDNTMCAGNILKTINSIIQTSVGSLCVSVRLGN